jgi:hypothetical protein
MKIAVLIPSEKQKEQAGVRIRYDRIAEPLKALGHSLELIPIQSLTEAQSRKHDVFLVSKCYDARAPLAAMHLAAAGKFVGVDLFDDYFSQRQDSRFIRLRHWLRAMLGHCSFILCSTARMAAVAGPYRSDLPIHVMNDPGPGIDGDRLVEAVRGKWAVARDSRRLSVAWFGMGDNPSFPVGLRDLVGYGGELDRLRGQGYEIHLDILTNRRALTPAALAAVRQLATPYRIDEWTEEGERELLARSLLGFLPVNSQPFSIAKSLNRAVSALASGTQVLSPGFPLYAALSPFIYRDSRQFVDDLQSGDLALREATVPQLLQKLSQVADAGKEASGLAGFLQHLRRPIASPAVAKRIAVIHGKDTLGDIHKLAQKLGAYSVASPFAGASLNYDIRFDPQADGRGYDVLLSGKVAGALSPALQRKLIPFGTILNTEYQVLRSAEIAPDLAPKGLALARHPSLACQTAAYPEVMGSVVSVLERLFPEVCCVFAEQNKNIPWHARYGEAQECVAGAA